MLYREPKLLKAGGLVRHQRVRRPVSVLYREPKLLKVETAHSTFGRVSVSVLYREPKLLKGAIPLLTLGFVWSFSALP